MPVTSIEPITGITAYGCARDEAALRRAGEAGAAELDIVGDPHGSASYKKHLLSVYLGRAVKSALAGGTGKEHA